MPGESAATQSRRCGKRPKLPDLVGATMRATGSHVAKTLNGNKILSRMRAPGFNDLRLRFRQRSACGASGTFGLIDRPDHIQRGFRTVLELIAQDALAAVERVFKADGLPRNATELLSAEKWLGQKSLESPRPRDHLAITG